MLTWIVSQSLELCKFISLLGLSLSIPQLRHVINVADALITADGKHKTLRKLNGTLHDPPTDEFAVADCFRQSPWMGAELRARVMLYLLRFTLELVRRLKLGKIIQLSFDDSFCIKDKDTRELEAVDWHHDHTASTKKRKVYHNGSVYVLCHLQIGWIEFTLTLRLRSGGGSICAKTPCGGLIAIAPRSSACGIRASSISYARCSLRSHHAYRPISRSMLNLIVGTRRLR